MTRSKVIVSLHGCNGPHSLVRSIFSVDEIPMKIGKYKSKKSGKDIFVSSYCKNSDGYDLECMKSLLKKIEQKKFRGLLFLIDDDQKGISLLQEWLGSHRSLSPTMSVVSDDTTDYDSSDDSGDEIQSLLNDPEDVIPLKGTEPLNLSDDDSENDELSDHSMVISKKSSTFVDDSSTNHDKSYTVDDTSSSIDDSLIDDDVSFNDWLLKYLIKEYNPDLDHLKCKYLSTHPPKITSIDWKTHDIIEYTKDNIPEGWESFFKTVLQKGMLDKVSEKIKSEEDEIFPQITDVYKAFQLTKLEDIKVVILGQDPYHTEGSAMGLAFSHYPTRTKKPQPSVRNIYKALKAEGYHISTENGDLEKWAKSGIFLINTALTVREGATKSHLKCWKKFTEYLLRYINKKRSNIVVMFWGRPANEYKQYFSSDKQYFISNCHPAASCYSKTDKFFTSNMFHEANDFFTRKGLSQVNWNL